MIEALREGLIYMLHTRDGARVAMFCLWHGTAKVTSKICLLVNIHAVKGYSLSRGEIAVDIKLNVN